MACTLVTLLSFFLFWFFLRSRSSHYITWNGRMPVGHKFEITWKESTALEFACNDWGKPRKCSARIARVPGEIRSGYLRIISLELYRCANLLGDTVHTTWLWLSLCDAGRSEPFRSFFLFFAFQNTISGTTIILRVNTVWVRTWRWMRGGWWCSGG
jgi:hypothetical protein